MNCVVPLNEVSRISSAFFSVVGGHKYICIFTPSSCKRAIQRCCSATWNFWVPRILTATGSGFSNSGEAGSQCSVESGFVDVSGEPDDMSSRDPWIVAGEGYPDHMFINMTESDKHANECTIWCVVIIKFVSMTSGRFYEARLAIKLAIKIKEIIKTDFDYRVFN